MKKYFKELLICTIVAAVCTLVTYILGLEQSWLSAANTFGVAFLTMFVLGQYLNRKKTKE